MQFKFIFICSVTFFLSSCVDDDFEKALKGTSMPYLKVQNMIGETLRIKPQGYDKPALINFWATWCKPCVLEMPSLEKVAENGEFRVVAISNDANRQKVSSFINDGTYKRIQFYYDAFGRQSRNVLNVQGLPMTLLVDRNAVIQHIFLGEKDWQSESIQRILGKYKIKQN